MNKTETIKDKIKRWKERKRQLRKLRKNKEKLKRHGCDDKDINVTTKQIFRECNALEHDIKQKEMK